MVNSPRNEYAGIDYFRVVAAFLVIAIHTSPLAGLNETADFVLTRVIARVAVPFFLMASGFFLFAKMEEHRQQFGKMMAFVKKTAAIYGITILFYLPLNAYAGTVKEWTNFPNLLKDIVFNGTFYHLWYLPASIVGACVVWLLLKKLKVGQAFVISLLLYVIGLFGDSYYGVSESIPSLKAVYQGLFLFFDYTRNGLFFAPIFLLLGALLARQNKWIPLKTCLIGFGTSMTLMLAEGLLLHRFHVQKHDSMYFMLLPCMFFLFRSLLLWKGESRKQLRSLSLLIYLIHPAAIVAVRGFAKAIGLQGLLIESSIIHFAAVTIGSIAGSVVLVMLLSLKRTRRTVFTGSPDRAWTEINMLNLHHNAKVLQEALPAGCEIMAVVKANAYGHGAVPTALYLNRTGVHSFGVATIDEGICLRKKGIKGDILILGYTPAVRASELSHYRLSQTLVSVEHARELNRFGKLIKVHIKVNTGMNRLGEGYRHVSEIASIFSCRHLEITGVFTHLCVSDSLEECDVAFTNQQIQRFYVLLDALKERHLEIPKIHMQSSYGVLNYSNLQCDYARIGIALYGVLSTPHAAKSSLKLRPVLSLKSTIVLVRTIKAGESVGYGQSFAAQHEMKIAVISIGYADGFPRSLSGKGCVLIRGYRASMIGRICMDQLIVDVTDIPDAQIGDVVTLIGRDGSEEITAEQVAFHAETITNELLSRLSDYRLKRVFANF